MFPCDLPEFILAQDPDRTRLADDCELVQLLVADAERAWEAEVEAARLRAAGQAPPAPELGP